jgi:DNA mismatch endonuclease, patch repair protein
MATQSASVFPRFRLAIFVDGCFWHGCSKHASVPQSNQEFWERKLARNKQRDRIVNRKIKELGWKPMRIWQHELRDP